MAERRTDVDGRLRAGLGATAMACRTSTLRNHLARGMAKLRADLGVTEVTDDG